MLITIYDRAGKPKAELSPNDSSTLVKEVQGDSILTLSFTHYEHIELDVDDYADFLGERFWLTEKYRPKQHSQREWAYDLKLYGVESMIKRLLVIKTVDGEDDPVFTLTAPAREHVAMIVNCMNKGMGNISDWKVGQVDGTENIVIDYHGKYCDEALKEIAEKVGSEWWVEGQTVNICKCEHGEPVALGYGKGLRSIEPDMADNVKFYTRLYPVGSSRNIDRERYGYSRLQLPGGAKYVEVNADKYGRVDHYEADAFADIYPRRTGEVSSVRSETRKGDDGKPFTIYYFTDDSLPFDPNDYEIGGLVKRVSFQEGSELGGLGDEDNGTYYFEVNFNSDTREFEIITIWPYGDDMQLPGGTLIPKAGDRYILWNIRMPDEYYALAEAEFMAAVNAYNADHAIDISVYKAPTDHVWIEGNGVDLQIGRRVRLESDKYFPGSSYRDSRITKITRKVNLPTSMDIEIGDALSRTSQQRMTDSITDVRSYAKSIKESISLPDIIKTGDQTLPTDNNLYSARRTQADFMSKVRDDRSKGLVASDVGFDVGEFLSGVSGGRIAIDKANGQSYAEVDKLYVRMKAFFESLTIINSSSIGGRKYITPGGSVRISEVEEMLDSKGSLIGWRCWYLAEQDGEKTDCFFEVGDQGICEFFNATSGTANKVGNTYYWRKVTEVSADAGLPPSMQGKDIASDNKYGWFVLSATDCESPSNDTPKAEDVVTQLGSDHDSDRQSAIMLSAVGADAPCIKLFQGIDSYSLSGKEIVGYGYDKAKGKAYFKCYGDTYIGAPDGSTFINYDSAAKLLEAKLKLTVTSTIGDKTIEEYIKEVAPSVKREDIEGFVNAIVDPKIEGIQNQIDGVIETWFYNGAPTLSNYPASEWNTEALRIQHLGDLYYDNDTGTAYRFSQKADKTYCWNVITDDAITKALAAAKTAQDTADSKRRTFTSQPTAQSEYDEGDIWVNATYGTLYNNDILRCIKPKASGVAFDISHWTLASKYTDDSALNVFIADYEDTIKDIQAQVDGKAETWYQATDPALAWKTAAEKAEHKGDLWYNTVNGTRWYYNGTRWQEENVPDAVFDMIDGKADIYVAKPTAGYHEKDLWFLEADYTLSGHAYKAGTLVVALRGMGAAWSANDWIKKDRYTDDALAQAAKDAAAAAQTAADNAQKDATAAKDRLDSWAADGVISPTEKQGIKDEIARIDGDKAHVEAEYVKYGLGSPSAFISAHSAYRSLLVTLSAATPENIAIPASFASKQTAYYSQRTTALSAISAAADKYAKDLVDALNTALKKDIAGYDYLRKALKDRTTIDGGLVLATLIKLGVNNADYTTQTTYSGISGVYDSTKKGGGIAAWYGGDMIDREIAGNESNPLRARALFRMDGTGYLADGLITWNPDGSGQVAGGKLRWDKAGNVWIGSGIAIEGGSSSATLASILNAINSLHALLVPIDANGNELSWETASTAYALKAKKALYSVGFMSALGLNPDAGIGGSAGATSLSGLSDVALASLVNGDVLTWNGSKWVNRAASTGGLDLTALQKYLTDNNYLTRATADGLYVTLNTAQTITGKKLFVGDANFRMQSDLSNAVGLGWLKTDASTVIAKISYHNTAQNLILNSCGATEIYSDAVGKYSLIVGKDRLTYNTHKIWHAGNDGSGSGLDADLLDGKHASWFAVFNEGLNANNADYNAYAYDRATLLTVQSVHVPNYTGQTNTPFGSTYGQMLTFGGDRCFFPFRLAMRYSDAALFVQAAGYKTTAKFDFSSGTAWKQLAFASEYYTKADADNRYARLAMPNNFCHASNEWTTIATDTTNLDLFINYRLASGSGSIYQYRFGNGTKNGYARVLARSFVMDGGQSNQVLMADGSLQTHWYAANVTTATLDSGMITPLAMNQWTSKTFLKLTGGTMANTNVVANLNADLLDGVHYRNILERTDTVNRQQDAAAKWYRVAQFKSSNAQGLSGILTVGRTYNSPANEAYVFAISLGYNGEINISQLSGNIGGHLISKIRVTCTNSGAAYVDIYCGYASYQNSLRVTAIGALTALDITPDPAALSITKEYATHAGLGCNGAITSHSEWFIAEAVGCGLYNSAHDARWYPLSDGWRADKAITSTGYVKGTHFLATTTTLCANLNADAVDGYHVGRTEGAIPWWGGLGYYNSVNNGDTADTSNYKNFLKRIVGTSPYGAKLGGYAFLGTLTPNSQRLIIGRAYNDTEIVNNYPRYSYFLSVALGGQIVTFGTNDGNYYQYTYARTIDNVASATKLQTARTLWGQSFDGTASVSGDLIGVQDIRMSRYLFLKHASVTKGYYLNAGSDGSMSICQHNNYTWTKSVMAFTADGKVGVNTSSPAYAVDVAGVLRATQGMFSDGYVSALGQNTGSDIRMKRILDDAVLSIDAIASAPAKFFLWKAGALKGQRAAGTIAQYWAQILPETVSERDDGMLQMQYDVVATVGLINLARITRNFMTQAERDIADLKATVTKQDGIIKMQERRISALERRLAA